MQDSEDISDVYRAATTTKNECDRLLENLESGKDKSVHSTCLHKQKWSTFIWITFEMFQVMNHFFKIYR